jgi:WD40 repeat protein
MLGENGRVELSFHGKEARIEDVETGCPVRILTTEDVIQWAMFSPDKRTVWAALRNGSMQVWDAKTGAPGLSWRGPSLKRAAFSPDGRWLAAISFAEEAIWVWDATNGNLLGSIDTEGEMLETLVFSTNLAIPGRGLIVATAGGDLVQMDGQSRPLRPEIPNLDELLRRNPWRYEAGRLVPTN